MFSLLYAFRFLLEMIKWMDVLFPAWRVVRTVGFRSIRAVSKLECGSASAEAADYRV